MPWGERVEAARGALACRLELLGGRAQELSALWQDQGFANRRDSSKVSRRSDMKVLGWKAMRLESLVCGTHAVRIIAAAIS